ncbi:hypothetical protein ACUN24_23515 [Pedobacter sp. WC2501]|uniref:hypothetical protein n=1 Tax=Pedobacter sp. WC2501 TaxID=3461400 RepID=UPI0040452A08
MAKSKVLLGSDKIGLAFGWQGLAVVLDITISIFPATKRHFFHKTLIMKTLFFRSMPRWHGTLERQSTQSALSIQQWAFYTTLRASKKQWHFVLCSIFLKALN